ncbi:MAG: VOC family protein [Acidimicrobiales bacterium]
MTATRPSTPAISHLVLNVRDIEASHRFYTEMLGFEQCGQLKSKNAPDADMRFYRGDGTHHHDVALIQMPNPEQAPPPVDWTMFPDAPGIAHIALAYPDRASWLTQIEHLQARGVEFKIRGNHGMTHSVYVEDPDGHGIEVLYDLPNEVWDGDVDAALSYFEVLPTTGPAALEDRVDYKVFDPAP